MSIERARRDLSIDTIIRKKGSLHTEIFPFISTSGLPKSVTVLVERHNFKQTGMYYLELFSKNVEKG